MKTVKTEYVVQYRWKNKKGWDDLDVRETEASAIWIFKFRKSGEIDPELNLKLIKRVTETTVTEEVVK